MSDVLRTLVVEKVVPGGHGLARDDGRIVLVRGAIPGETVRVRLQRAGKGGVLFADVAEVLEPSPDRCEPAHDPRCGGLAFAHVRYERQLDLKREMLADALRRVGRVVDLPAVDMLASPPDGWRLRARLHVEAGRVGFFREGTHTLCDPPPSQLPERMAEAARVCVAALPAAVRADLVGLLVAEDLAGEAAAVHLELQASRRLGSTAMTLPDGLAGVTAGHAGVRQVRWWVGDPHLREPVTALIGGTADGHVSHQPAAFFQANRAIVPELVRRALAWVEPGPFVDLFAGVGLFGVCAAAQGVVDITCVEGDPLSAEDLRRNAANRPDAISVWAQSVESFVQTRPDSVDGATVLVDPPRTGLPTEVTQALCEGRPSRVIYVSCDAATFARDLRQMLTAGWHLQHLEAFDMFPQSAHLETLAVLDR
jgi:23S rRNA (uracil1939-C5)-methyltransferase